MAVLVVLVIRVVGQEEKIFLHHCDYKTGAVAQSIDSSNIHQEIMDLNAALTSVVFVSVLYNRRRKKTWSNRRRKKTWSPHSFPVWRPQEIVGHKS